jgi:hypothetical protein
MWGGDGDYGADVMEEFIEFDPTPLIREEDLNDFPNIPRNATKILVQEPCNSVSNVAYFHLMLEICEFKEWTFHNKYVTALIQSTNMLTQGSLFYHASATQLGSRLDKWFIQVMALTAHQAALQSIPYDPILHDLSETPKTYSGPEQAESDSIIIMKEAVDMWYNEFPPAVYTYVH